MRTLTLESTQPEEAIPGNLGSAGVATGKYQAQVHILPFQGSTRCRCDAEL
jgi:hypothetical protein